jgi:hypothetical protein
MKHFTSLASVVCVCLLSVNPGTAQTTHSIEQGANYAQDVYFSLETGIVATVPADNWDIALEVTNPFAIGIRINDGNGRELAVYPNGDLSAWNTVDSTGFSTWPKRNNGLDLWETGAFNTGFSGDPMDFGWGVYSGPPLHQVVGDSLYIFKRADGSALKLRINDLSNGLWSFTYAELDGANEVTSTVAMADYADRNFVYFHFTNGVVDREPATGTWDLVFTRYVGPTQYGLFPTTGILLNRDRAAAEGDGVDVNAAVHTDYTLTTDSIVTIGNDWKSLVNFMWQIDGDRVYFVQTGSGAIHKLIFTGFTGSSTGITTFTSEVASAVGIAESPASSIQVYPNPVTGNTLYLSGCSATSTAEVWSLAGARIASLPAQAAPGTPATVALDGLPAGTYLIRVADGTATSTHRIVIL